MRTHSSRQTLVTLGEDRKFRVAGLDRNHWSNATPIRKIFEMHLRLLACRTSIHIVCAKRWSSLAKHVAAHRRSSRHGVRILVMRKF
jgi:hypothetical protein